MKDRCVLLLLYICLIGIGNSINKSNKPKERRLIDESESFFTSSDRINNIIQTAKKLNGRVKVLEKKMEDANEVLDFFFDAKVKKEKLIKELNVKEKIAKLKEKGSEDAEMNEIEKLVTQKLNSYQSLSAISSRSGLKNCTS